MFLDEVTISVKSGRGGRGCESYLRRPDRKMVPMGGDGGAGGDVIVRADLHTGSLFPLKSKRVFEAEAGGLGKGNNRYGHNGEPLVLKVPCGTTVHDHSQKLLLRDLSKPGDEVMVVKGGRGGYGNHAGRPATFGEEGKALELFLSFTIIADVFLVGLPNSGKTTLLQHLTGAHVDSTEYPFATKFPCLGTYETKTGAHLRICELPSIYGRSSEGKGLGSHFLKHLKRARLIFFVLDPLNSFARHTKAGYDILTEAVKQFHSDFLGIPRFVVVNKIDAAEAKKAISKKDQFPDPVFKISALTGEGIQKLMRETTRALGTSTPSNLKL